MKNNEILENLIKSQEEFRQKKDDEKCISIFKQIIDIINNFNDDNKFDIISKLFLLEDQSNYTKISIFNDLLKNNNIIKTKTDKTKYYQLLIDSFTKNKTNDHSEQVNKIKDLYNNSDLNDFEKIDMYIELFIAEKDMKNDMNNFGDDITDRELVFDEPALPKKKSKKKYKYYRNSNSKRIYNK